MRMRQLQGKKATRTNGRLLQRSEGSFWRLLRKALLKFYRTVALHEHVAPYKPTLNSLMRSV
jgi:hypothetical protein